MRLTQFIAAACLVLIAQPGIVGAEGHRASREVISRNVFFTENAGQHSSDVRFISQGGSMEAVFFADKVLLGVHSKRDSAGERTHAGVMVEFASGPSDTNADRNVFGQNLLLHTTNFYLGNDSSRWRTDVRNFGSIRYSNLCAGIDAVWYGSEKGRLEFDLIVSPGADPEALLIRYQGASSVGIGLDGEVVVHTSAGDIVQLPPRIYQTLPNGQVVALRGSFEFATSDSVQFRMHSSYDDRLPLVIDPEFEYGTFFGGTDSEDQTFVAARTDGTIYVTGQTYNSVNDEFPLLPNNQPPPPTGINIFVSKFRLRNDGKYDLLASAIIGGTGSDIPQDIAIDSSGGVGIVGETSGNFPVTQQAYQTTFGGIRDGFVLRLSSNGGLVASTYLGASETEILYGIDFFNTSGNTWQSQCSAVQGDYVYVTGYSQDTATDYPTTPNAMDPTHNGETDAVFSILTPGLGCLAYSTFIGSNRVDSAYGVAAASNGMAWVVGGANNGPAAGESFSCSTHFPLVNAWDTTFEGNPGTSGASYSEAFICKIDPNPALGSISCPIGAQPQQLRVSTFAGGGETTLTTGCTAPTPGVGANNAQEYCFRVALDAFDTAYIVGATPACNWPATLNGGCDTKRPLPDYEGGKHRACGTADYDGFMVVMNASGELQCATTFAGTTPATPAGTTTLYEWLYGVGLDSEGRIWVAGHTPNENVVNSPSSYDAYQDTHSGGGFKDIYLGAIRLETGQNASLEYFTYLGGEGDDYQYGFAIDASGNLYVSGWERMSPDFDTSHGAYSPNEIGSRDAVVCRFDVARNFRRGDLDGDGDADASDVDLLYGMLAVPPTATTACVDTADINDDGLIDAADYAWLRVYVYSSGAAPLDPFPSCGGDPSADALAYCLYAGTCP